MIILGSDFDITLVSSSLTAVDFEHSIITRCLCFYQNIFPDLTKMSPRLTSLGNTAPVTTYIHVYFSALESTGWIVLPDFFMSELQN